LEDYLLQIVVRKITKLKAVQIKTVKTMMQVPRKTMEVVYMTEQLFFGTIRLLQMD